MVISFLFFFLAIIFYKKNKYQITVSLFFTSLVLSVLALDIFYIISDYFTGNGITDSSIYYLEYGFNNGLNSMGFIEYKWLVVLVILVITFIVFFLHTPFFLSKERGKKKGYLYYYVAPFFFILVSLWLSPSTHALYNSYFALGEEKNTNSVAYNFFDYYKYPVIHQTGKKKNLVFIYAESLENTYSDETIFPGLTPGLNGLAAKGISFTNVHQVDGTGFTMGGVVASQCGISLFGIPYGNSMSGMDSYLPSATCLGDLLHKEGYYLSYFGGANSVFAGKDLFYATHGFDEVLGSEELLKNVANPTYKTNWGAYDDTLFDGAYPVFLGLSEKKTNFGLFLLTLDTHQPEEKPSKSCITMKYKDGKDNTLNAVHCSDYLITDFVNKILNSPQAKDTVIVIASDHLAPHDPRNDSSGHIDRSNRLIILSPEIITPNKVENFGSTLDTGSTLLPFIGFTGDIGLGRNLLNPQQSEYETRIIQWRITSWVKDFMNFWNFPKIKDTLAINTNEKYILIDSRKFKIPVLVEVDSNMQTSLKFQFDLEFSTKIGKSKWELFQMTKNLDKNKTFLLVDYCKNMQEAKQPQGNTIFCLMKGKGEKYSIEALTEEGKTITVDDIKILH